MSARSVSERDRTGILSEPPGGRGGIGASTLRLSRLEKESVLSRPPLRALLPAALVLAGTAPLALAKPTFDTGPYLGSVAAKNAPPVEFTATKKRVTKLDIGSLHVTCSDGRAGTVNMPGPPGKRSFKLTRGKFAFAVKAPGADPQNAGTRLTGKLKGRKATGTVRVVLKRTSPAGTVVCDTGRRRWTARAEEILVELP